jgi:hypothetical protein
VGNARRGLFKLGILILLIPVALVLLLRIFGENRMEVPVLQTISDCSLEIPTTAVFLTGKAGSTAQMNQLKRLKKQLDERNISLFEKPRPCLGDSLAILLIDGERKLRGRYHLEHKEVNRLLVELDIVRLNEKNNSGVSR